MKTKESKTKTFDAVKFMRDTRDQISQDVQGMNYEQLIKYYKERRLTFKKKEEK